MKYLSHLSLGNTPTLHRKVTLPLCPGNKDYDYIVENYENIYNFEYVYILNGYEHRPDLIANVFYNTPEYEWLVLLVNHISDPFEDLNVGDRIRLPVF